MKNKGKKIAIWRKYNEIKRKSDAIRKEFDQCRGLRDMEVRKLLEKNAESARCVLRNRDMKRD